MSDKYILEGKTPVPVDDLMTWALWFEKADRHVAKNQIGEAFISTVFLGLDHSWEKGEPLLFKTMILGGSLDGEQERTSTWEQAEEAHKRMIDRVMQ